jgi:hypothetical protein
MKYNEIVKTETKKIKNKDQKAKEIANKVIGIKVFF